MRDGGREASPAMEDRGIALQRLPLYHFEDLNVVGARPIKSATGRPDMWKLVKRLGQMEIIGLLIEGGALDRLGGACSGHRGQSLALLRAEDTRRHRRSAIRQR